MKKNRMMRLASLLLVMVLMTTSVISGTFAKYTTQDSASDSARVAKWGVELQVVGNLFGDTYKDTIVKENDDTLTVQSVDKNADVVAPGTKNEEGFTFSLKGQPEVNGEVTTTMKIQNVFLKEGSYGVLVPVDTGVVTDENFDEFENLYTMIGTGYSKAKQFSIYDKYYTLEDDVKISSDYYPVVYHLGGNTNTTDTTEKTTNDSLKSAAEKIATQLGLTAGSVEADTSVTYTGTKKFEANTDLATWCVDGLTLTWSWAFGEVDKIGDNALNADKADTILGLLENNIDGSLIVKGKDGQYVRVEEYTDYCLDTQFSIDITVTQVD